MSYFSMLRFFLIFIVIWITPLSVLSLPNSEGIQTYQPNLQFSEERIQNLREDIDRYMQAENIWDVLRSEFILPHYEELPEVQEQIRWFMNNQGFLIRTATRASPYLYYVLQQVHKRHLPAELVLLPMIESAYNPLSYSTMGAAGLWQLMPNTASGFGIQQNDWYDGRRDVLASTNAALNYLSYLQNFFTGNWLLAIAAYDAGEGTVSQSIKKSRTLDFWSLTLPQETKIYVPRFLALATIIAHPEKYPINLPSVPNAPYLAQIEIGGEIDLHEAAYLAGISLKEMKNLNSGFNKSIANKLILPIEHVGQFSMNLASSPSYDRSTWTHYTIQSGDTLHSVAEKYRTNDEELKKINPIVAENFRTGKNLVIPKSSRAAYQNNGLTGMQTENSTPLLVDESYVQPIKNYTLQPGDTLYMIRTGDDIPKISKRFHIQSETILAVNKISRNKKLVSGGTIIIPTHLTHSINRYAMSPGDTIYLVRSGETLHSIANKFQLSPAAIRIANLMASNDVRDGDRLIIPTHG